ncbi:MAG: membrane protein insertase YidC [Opitutaceae bacterium]|nr:membrane protein insertase YidC [Opitutaceae bacterium]
MDKKNTTIGVLLLVAAFVFMIYGPKTPPPPAPVETKPVATDPAAPGAPAATGGATAAPAASTAFAAVNRDATSATVTTLSNDFIEARFTDSGGALLAVAFKKYTAELKKPAPYVFNQDHADPILAFVDFAGLDRRTRYERVSHTANEIVYRAVFEGRLEVTRRYIVSPNTGDATDPYLIRHETIFRNLTDQAVTPMRVGFSLGTAAPNDRADPGLYLKTGFSNGSDQTFIPRSDLEASSGFLGMGAHPLRPEIQSGGPLTWVAVKNQFFTSILTGDEPAANLITRRVKLVPELHDDDLHAYGITGSAHFDTKPLAAKGEFKLGGSLYVGPKEYARLSNGKVFKADQHKIMDFGFFRFFSEILLTLMTWIHNAMPASSWAWGWAIVFTTLTLKIIFIYPTLSASKSAKRMAKIQPELQAIREKYKDNPQKQQQATMELFKTRKINPIGGCLPILLTMPFFMGFFTMLPSAAELRFQPFLWAPDLSTTDTIAQIPLGFMTLPLNIMPLLMGATMIIQMHLTPTPSVDNAQVKMMKFMPYIFAFICYNFSCALSLYSFVNGLFSIGQQLVINRMKDPIDTPPAVAVSPGGKVVKNVTPKKKK